MKILVLLLSGVAMLSSLYGMQKDINKEVQPIKVLYTNYRHETDLRTIIPQEIFWGSTEYHPEEQWLLKVWDVEKQAERIYALKDIQKWYVE